MKTSSVASLGKEGDFIMMVLFEKAITGSVDSKLSIISYCTNIGLLTSLW